MTEAEALRAAAGTTRNGVPSLDAVVASWAMRQNWRSIGPSDVPQATAVGIRCGMVIPVLAAAFLSCQPWRYLQLRPCDRLS